MKSDSSYVPVMPMNTAPFDVAYSLVIAAANLGVGVVIFTAAAGSVYVLRGYTLGVDRTTVAGQLTTQLRSTRGGVAIQVDALSSQALVGAGSTFTALSRTCELLFRPGDTLQTASMFNADVAARTVFVWLHIDRIEFPTPFYL